MARRFELGGRVGGRNAADHRLGSVTPRCQHRRNDEQDDCEQRRADTRARSGGLICGR
ncbi:hypothetical protein DB30_03321 [Enhygromyxa salina]|uniref:Uncharacterized protein n=1 Tax=Enhygromyxa salina TaxID=215803 RepID=A0A0C2DCG1_9BACT|nr:hypothetical protein DB30_03321 [Enhygromyxa salina]